MPDLLKPFFDEVQKKNWQKTGKIFTVCSGPASQAIGVVELVAREPLMFARVENVVTKCSPEKEEGNLGLQSFHF